MCISTFLTRVLFLLCILKDSLVIANDSETNAHKRFSDVAHTMLDNITQHHTSHHLSWHHATQATKHLSTNIFKFETMPTKLAATQQAHNQAHNEAHFSKLYTHPFEKKSVNKVNKGRGTLESSMFEHAICNDKNPLYVYKKHYLGSFFEDILNKKNNKSNRIEKLNNGVLKRKRKEAEREKWKRLVVVRPSKTFQVPETTKKSLFKLEKNYLETFSIKHKASPPEVAPQLIFEIDDLTGMVNLKKGKRLDFEKFKSIDFTILIARLDDYSFLEEQPVRLQVQDVNDEIPIFINAPQPLLSTLPHNAPRSHVVYQLLCSDADKESSHDGAGDIERFEVDDRTGVVRTKGSSPYPRGKEYQIGVSCSDVAAPTTQKSLTHPLKVLVGERDPQFFKLHYESFVLESAPVSYKVVEVKAISHQSHTIRYTLFSHSDQFSIHPENGHVTLSKTLDFEKDPHQFHLRVQASESGEKERKSFVNLVINVVDCNDNSPTFPLSQYVVHGIPEGVSVGTDIIQVTATDADSVTNSQLTYSLDDDTFTVQTLNNIGYVKTAKRLDYDRIPDHTYNFTIIATDNGVPSLQGSASIRVTVSNVNDEKPVFLQPVEKVQISDDVGLSTVLHVVQAFDPDGDDVAYRFAGDKVREGPFSIEERSGIITLTGPLRREHSPYQLNITAVDNGKCCSGRVSRRSYGTLIFDIKTANNNAPRFPNCSYYRPVVMEKENVGTFVIKVQAVDPDTNANLTYSLVESSDRNAHKFEIDSSSGVMRTIDVFDREERMGVVDYGVTVKAEEQGPQALAGFCTFRVKIGDKNDNPPVFQLPHFRVSVQQASPVGKRIKQVYATDRDSGENGKVEYQLRTPSFFGIHPHNGWVYVAKPITKTQNVSIQIEARDKGIPSKSSFVTMDIEITRSTSAYPQWKQDYSKEVIYLSENAPANTVVAKLKAYSQLANTTVNYVIQSADSPELNGEPISFYHRTDPVTNEMVIMTYGTLDFEKIPKYLLTIKASNRASNSQHNETHLTVVLKDENDEIPQFVGLNINGRYSGSIAENLAAGTEVLSVSATDRDEFMDYKKVYYRIKQMGDDWKEFSIDRNTGKITSRRAFDREVKSEFYITVVAEDGAPSDRPNHLPLGTPNMGEAEVQIRVADVNDNPPFFREKVFYTRVPENTDKGTVIITVTAEDLDNESKLTYSITSGNEGNAFEVVAELGEIKVRGDLDYEKGNRSYTLKYRVFDDKYSNEASIRVNILDVNDNPPVFDHSVYNVTNLVEEQANISKNNPKYLLTVRATDPDVDRNSQVKYSLTGQFALDGTFYINKHTGEIFLTRSLDRDATNGGRPIWNFNVLAHDESDAFEPSLTGYSEVRVIPRDINDNAPIFDRNRLVGTVAEHSKAGVAVMTVIATDPDNGNNGSVSYSLKQVPKKDKKPLFSIDSHIGLITTTISDALDREFIDKYNVIVQARDRGSPSMIASAVVTIQVEDINDHAPKFTHSFYKASISENSPPGSTVLTVSATDMDIGQNCKLTYSLDRKDRSSFVMHTVESTNSGVIKVFKPMDFDTLEHAIFNMSIHVRDPLVQHNHSSTVQITITDYNDNPPVFNPTNKKVDIFENATIGSQIFQFTASDNDTGENGRFTFSIDSSTDPGKHFSISQEGVLRTNALLDRESIPSYNLHVLAVDHGCLGVVFDV